MVRVVIGVPATMMVCYRGDSLWFLERGEKGDNCGP